MKSLCQGHDDEQKTAIFQKALLVGNEVWMCLSTKKNLTLHLFLRIQLKEPADNPFRRLTSATFNT